MLASQACGRRAPQLRGAALGRFARRVPGERLDLLQPVADRTDAHAESAGGGGRAALLSKNAAIASVNGSAPPRDSVSGPSTVRTRSVMAAWSRSGTGNQQVGRVQDRCPETTLRADAQVFRALPGPGPWRSWVRTGNRSGCAAGPASAARNRGARRVQHVRVTRLGAWDTGMAAVGHCGGSGTAGRRRRTGSSLPHGGPAAGDASGVLGACRGVRRPLLGGWCLSRRVGPADAGSADRESHGCGSRSGGAG